MDKREVEEAVLTLERLALAPSGHRKPEENDAIRAGLTVGRYALELFSRGVAAQERTAAALEVIADHLGWAVNHRSDAHG